MAQPPAFVPAFSYTDWTANHPTDPQPGVRLDIDFTGVRTTTDAIRANLALIQRDDGVLANASVGPDQLSPELTLGLRSITEWAPGHDYVANDAVWTSGLLYRALVSHTSAAAFATDLTAGRWVLIYNLALAVPAAINAAIAAGTINVNVDTSNFASLNGTNAFSGANSFAAACTFSVAPKVKVNTAATAGNYLALEPTDLAAGKPGFYVRKKSGATAWAIEIDDGAAGTGSLALPAATTLGGASPVVAADLTPLTVSIRRARNIALNAR